MANMSSTDINKSQTSKTNKTKAKGNSSSSKSYKVRTFKEYSEGATEASKSIENKSYEFPGIDKVNGLVVVFDVWDMAATGEGLLNDISAGTAKMVADLNQNLNTMVKSVQNLGGDSVSSISGIENTVMDIGGVFKSAFGVEAGKFKDSGAVISGYTAAFEKLKDINSSSNGAGDLIVPKPTELSFKFPVMTKLGDDSNYNYKGSEFNFNERSMETVLDTLNSGIDSLLPVGKIMSKISKEAQEMASRNGSVFNPNLISVYTGTDLRAFQFSFSCVIENRKDWVNYMEMYNSLKYISAGVLAGSNSAYINTPSAVSFRFFKYNQGDTGTRVKDYDYIFRSNTYQKEDPSGKSSLRNYSLFFIKKVESDLGNDAMNVYFDGAPKIASIKISIEERKPRYDKDWK